MRSLQTTTIPMLLLAGTAAVAYCSALPARHPISLDWQRHSAPGAVFLDFTECMAEILVVLVDAAVTIVARPSI